MKTQGFLYLPAVSGKFAPGDRVPKMVVVPCEAKQVLEDLLAATATFRHPNLAYYLFSNVATGARLLCALKDLEREYVDNGMSTEDLALDRLEEWDDHLWIDDKGAAFVPYLLSEPDREPQIVIWNDGAITLRWDAVDTEPGEQPLESDFFQLSELCTH